MESLVLSHEQEVSEKMYCGCGNVLHEELHIVQWSDSNGRSFTIRAVPVLQCNNEGCLETYYPADVELNLGFFADEMEQGILPDKIDYKERF